MSGHSKWSKVKHQKATTDAVKGAAFTKAAHAITVAVREGGAVGDPNHNFRLRLAIEKAREVNVPKENIERAIEKGTGTGEGTIEQVLYEGYSAGGVALLVEAATDNRQRTVSSIKNVFDRHGGTLAQPGAVSYLFERCGILTVPKGSYTSDEMLEKATDSGAQDLAETADMFEIYTEVNKLSDVKTKLTIGGVIIDNTEIIMKPKAAMPVGDDTRKKMDALVEALEALEDVQKVFANTV